MATTSTGDCSEENGDVNMAETKPTADIKPSAEAPVVIPSRSVVHYKSSALDEIGMLKRPASEVMNCPGVLAAHETAEKVREAFKLKEKEKREADMQMNMEANAKIPVAGGDIDKGARYDRRTKLNRQSAAASRIRKEAYIKALEQQLLIHDDKYKELERSFLEEQTAHTKLKQETAQLATGASSVNASMASLHINNNTVKQEELEIPGIPSAEALYDVAPPDPAVIQQIFTNPTPPVPSNEIELHLPPIGSPSYQLQPDDFVGFNLPFEHIPQSFLENTSPF